MDNKLLDECREKSITLLKENSTKYGILASSKSKRAVARNYLSVFGRDAAICALGMAVSGDKELLNTAKKSLQTLAENQADNGQIPNYVKTGEKTDFWRIGCIDATLWWLFAVDFISRHSKFNLIKSLNKNVNAALNWLKCQEHPKDGLLIQNEASDWADLMPRSGKVLFDNALWYAVKKMYGQESAVITKKNFNNLFYPFDDKIGTLPHCEKTTVALIKKKEKPTHYYLSFVNYLFWGGDLNIFGNSLAILFGLPKPSLRKAIIKEIFKKRRRKSLPMPVLLKPIKENSKYWREYMESHKQNFPYQYHNGGIWPFASCFWAMALFKAGKKDEAREELVRIANANKVNNWQFNEWFHAKTGEPLGMHRQSWNAGAYLLALSYLGGKIKI